MSLAAAQSIHARIAQIESQFSPAAPVTTDQGGSAEFSAALANAVGSDPSELDTMLRNAGLASSPSLGRFGANGGSTQPTGNDVVAAATKYLGIPYLWGGTDPQIGLDCSGLVQQVFEDLGMEVPRVSRDQAKVGTEVPSLDEALPGDLLTFGSPVNHIGIYVGNGQMLHAPHTGEVVKVGPIHREIATIRRMVPAESQIGPSDGMFPMSAPLLRSAPNGSAPAAAQQYLSMFAESGQRHGIDPALLAAVAKTESAFNPNAVSSAGAKGLMQFMPATANDLGINPSDPRQAVDGAARYLKTQLSKFGSVDLALAAYNAGPGAVSRFGGIPPYSETRSYVRKVTSSMNETKNWFGGPS